ncbi:xylose isomerase [Variovorax sp. PBL-E5]|uniref:xylose isomerase n=1 Tax=Variovorax sp. PBL-E5 TaxID=434014 RepID=UPI001319A6DF|nr:xylose isomerase [Variovorax sp. PBL-E5]VTU36011.1 hypothetical protein E5CHR_04208 [Variovorax sp. PBL-E5]
MNETQEAERAVPELLIGCSGRGVRASSPSAPVTMEEHPIDTQFAMVKESGVFDYLARLPSRGNLDPYLAAMRKHDLRIEQPTWYYLLGRDEALLRDNLLICSEVGVRHHNIMTFTHHADGHALSDQEVVDHYLDTYDFGMARGVEPSFEVHVNMWTEQFKRVAEVANAVQARGIPFNFTMDYSHATFKIGNPAELEISGVREEVEDGRIVLDPFEKGSLCAQWLAQGIVRLVQFRPAGPNQPPNVWARNEDGSATRGIQYPMMRPAPGEWHSPWHAYLLEPSKEALRKALAHHLGDPASRLRCVTTELIDMPDYGMGAKYDLFEQNVEAARFVRRTWQRTQALHAAGLLEKVE